MFETIAEPKLIQPTLLYDFPTDISPLSKCRDDDPTLVERFEVYVAGMELGNAFSELNDPDEQERRFREQVERGGEEVPREVDLDYVRALAHGLPPTAGMGIGIDRLTMLLTDSHSIREVILFPLLRPEAARSESVDAPDAEIPASPDSGNTRASAMKFAWLVARRYLRSPNKPAVLRLVTLLAVIGVTAGVATLVIALSMNTGFRRTLQDRLLGVTAHVKFPVPAPKA